MANLLDKASIILTPTAYSDGKIHSAKPIVSTNPSVGDFDFARASVGTRVNENGLIEEVASGLPRIDYTDGSGSWLLEPASTNLITYSEDFSNAIWTKSGNTVVTLNNAISPDGTLNASTVTGLSGTSTNDLYTQPTFNTSNKTVTYSVYLKGSGTLRINVSNNIDDNSSKTLTLTNNWERYFITYSFNASASTQMVCNLDDLSATATTYEVWGAQLEENSYSTSYIKTVGTTQTRSADTANGAGNSTVINSSEGVLYAEISALADDLSERRFGISDGTSSNVVRVSYTSESNKIIAVVYNGSNQAILSYVSSDITQNSKIAFKYKANDFALWVDGVERSTGTIGSVFTANTLNSLDFNIGGLNNFYGKIKSLQVYTTALSDAELTSLTTI